MGSCISKSSIKTYESLKCLARLHGRVIDEESLITLSHWLVKKSFKIPKDLNCEFWDNIGAELLTSAHFKNDLEASEAIPAWKTIFKILENAKYPISGQPGSEAVMGTGRAGTGVATETGSSGAEAAANAGCGGNSVRAGPGRPLFLPRPETPQAEMAGEQREESPRVSPQPSTAVSTSGQGTDGAGEPQPAPTSRDRAHVERALPPLSCPAPRHETARDRAEEGTCTPQEPAPPCTGEPRVGEGAAPMELPLPRGEPLRDSAAPRDGTAGDAVQGEPRDGGAGNGRAEPGSPQQLRGEQCATEPDDTWSGAGRAAEGVQRELPRLGTEPRGGTAQHSTARPLRGLSEELLSETGKRAPLRPEGTAGSFNNQDGESAQTQLHTGAWPRGRAQDGGRFSFCDWDPPPCSSGGLRASRVLAPSCPPHPEADVIKGSGPWSRDPEPFPSVAAMPGLTHCHSPPHSARRETLCRQAKAAKHFELIKGFPVLKEQQCY